MRLAWRRRRLLICGWQLRHGLEMYELHPGGDVDGNWRGSRVIAHVLMHVGVVVARWRGGGATQRATWPVTTTTYNGAHVVHSDGLQCREPLRPGPREINTLQVNVKRHPRSALLAAQRRCHQRRASRISTAVRAKSVHTNSCHPHGHAPTDAIHSQLAHRNTRHRQPQYPTHAGKKAHMQVTRPAQRRRRTQKHR